MKYLYISLLLALAAVAQDVPIPPHRSALTPPPIPFTQPFLKRMPKHAFMFYSVPGKEPEMFSMGAMQMEELLEKIRTNRYNLFLVELHDADPPQLKKALISEEDELVLSNHHRAMPQHP